MSERALPGLLGKAGTELRMLFLFSMALAQSVSGAVDLHIHLAAHLAVPVYGRGPEATPPAHPSNLHSLQPQIFLEDLEKPGPSILVSLAYADPFLTVLESHASMSARIQRQLDYVEDFGKKHADHFGVAHTPLEARTILTSGRTVIVQGIEGATKILENSEDARHWAQEGVAVRLLWFGGAFASVCASVCVHVSVAKDAGA